MKGNNYTYKCITCNINNKNDGVCYTSRRFQKNHPTELCFQGYSRVIYGRLCQHMRIVCIYYAPNFKYQFKYHVTAKISTV